MLRNAALAVAILLAGCATATLPQGPNVAVMPGPGKTFAQFAKEERECRAYASKSIGTDVNKTSANTVAQGAAVGTALGAAAGALLGGHQGAAAGAGMGLIVGTAQGAGAAESVENQAQRRYDIAYEQCMYAKGNQLPQAPSVTYYDYRNRRQPVVIYRQAPATVVPNTPPPPPPPPPPQ